MAMLGDRRSALAPLRRGVRRFGRRPLGTRVRTVAVAVAVLAGLVVWLAASPRAGAATGGATPQSAVPASTRGVTATSINVVFPVVNLNSLSGKLGFAEDAEYGQQVKAIHVFVDAINGAGGINGRKIDPIISFYDPTNATEMRALCKDWTEGSPAAFAVLDGIGAWAEDSQLCITQEGHTPLISAWTTIPNWTQKGAPYLWWTGPNQAQVLAATVQWGLQARLLGGGRKVGVVVGDRQSDQLALNDYLLPMLRAHHITPTVETIAADPSETATTQSQAPLVVAKLKSAGDTSVIPLIPFNVFFPMLQAETQQQYFPKLLLSDYEDSIESALGLIPVPYDRALNGQEGVTTETLGGFDDDRPESQGGYDPGVRSCYETWHAVHPGPIPGASEKVPFIEEQGPIQAWCTTIRLFAAAAKAAGRDLNRRTFLEAMAKVTDFPGGYSPVWSFGPHKYAGPIEYRVVRLHNNVGKNACVLKTDHKPQGTCWQVMSGWRPLPAG
jgi:hypothetical protein